jgi:mono/diheme cytochrome c family protein
MPSRFRRPTFAQIALLLVIVGEAGSLALHHWRTKGLSAVQRGELVAQNHGCFGCHGPGGVAGFEDASGAVGAVPSFTSDGVEGHAKTVDEIREWVRDGKPARLRALEEGEEAHEVFQMPAFRDLLTAAEIDDVVAYVRAAAAFQASTDKAAVEGREVGTRLGCFQCHGPQGRGCAPNPGSFKGYIPSWDGEDYPELVRDDSELREWILDGSCRRLREHPIAKRFIARQVVKMPAFKGHISDADVDTLVAYVHWLRTTPDARQGR